MGQRRRVEFGRSSRAIERVVRHLATSTGGQDLVEYGLLASLISIVSIGALSTLGIGVAETWSRIANDLIDYFS